MESKLLAAAALIIDDDDIVREANDAAVALIGQERGALVGAAIDRVVLGLPTGPAGARARFEAVLPGAVRTQPVHLWCCRLAPGRTAVLLLEAERGLDAECTLSLVMAGVEQSPDGFEITDGAGRAEYANPAVLRLLERPQFDVLGAPIWRYLGAADAGAVEAAVRALEAFRGEVSVVMPSGIVRTHELTMHPVVDAVGAMPRFVVVRRDVSARVEAEREVERLRHRLAIADRHGVVGQLAAALAHEMNNPATYVVTNVSLAIEDLSSLRAELTGDRPAPLDLASRIERIEEMLLDVQNGSDRIVALVRALRDARPSEGMVREPVVVSEVARDALALSRAALDDRARVVADLTAPGVVLADRIGLGQVLVNVLAHVAAALPEGSSEEHEVRISTREAASYVEVTVRDTAGRVQPSATDFALPRWLESDRWVGDGLGLEIARRVVASLGGTLTVTALDPAGEVFCVRLPRTSA